ADDLVPRPIGRSADGDALADRIHAREFSLCEGFVDDDGTHTWIRCVVLLEKTTLAQRDAHRLEIAWRDCVPERHPILRRSDVALDAYAVELELAFTAQWKLARERGGLHAGYTRDRDQRVREEPFRVRIVEASPGCLNLHHQKSRRPEPGVEREQSL